MLDLNLDPLLHRLVPLQGNRHEPVVPSCGRVSFAAKIIDAAQPDSLSPVRVVSLSLVKQLLAHKLIAWPLMFLSIRRSSSVIDIRLSGQRNQNWWNMSCDR